ncbi:MAG TPA: hydroxymethylbilane synthase [Candidatus Kapabacteria bacterium]|jgi:hydroxymethylbilane synthase
MLTKSISKNKGISKQKLIIGSRASDLALWQTNAIRSQLLERSPSLDVTVEIIHTTGDRFLDAPLSTIGGKGVFTKEIENALLDGTIDIAVHSLKDLPTTLADGLRLGAIPKRANVEDVFLSHSAGTQLMDLPDGATIATGSLRRKAQLLMKRPDFRIADIRGNVPTRIRKLMTSEWDGMVLARAGVERLGLTEHLSHVISLEWILPAAGQGAMAVECRSHDAEVLALLQVLNDETTLRSVTAERALLAALGGGCQAPVGAHALVQGSVLELTATIVAVDGSSHVRAVHTGSPDDAQRIGEELAKTLLDAGGREILDSISRNQEPAMQDHPEA